jgi:hypothetical protein
MPPALHPDAQQRPLGTRPHVRSWKPQSARLRERRLAARVAELGGRLVKRLDPPDDYNFRHFRLRHMAAELLRTARAADDPRPRAAGAALLAGPTGGAVALVWKAARRW